MNNCNFVCSIIAGMFYHSYLFLYIQFLKPCLVAGSDKPKQALIVFNKLKLYWHEFKVVD